MKLILYIFLILLLINLLSAKWTYYDKTNTPLLGGNFITSINQDIKGNYWFNEEYGGGLTRFDGNKWERFGYLAESFGLYNQFMPLACDSLGNNWFGIAGGLLKYDGIEFSIITGYNSNIPKNIDKVNKIIVDKNNFLWLATSTGGIIVYDNKNDSLIKRYDTTNSPIPTNFIADIIIDPWDGALWAVSTMGFAVGNPDSSSKSGLVRFHNNNWTVYTPYNSDFNQFYSESMVIDSLHNIWIGSVAALLKFDGKNWTSYHKEIAQYTCLSSVLSGMVVDKNNNLWIAAAYCALLKFDGINWTMFKKNSNPGILDNQIASIYVDKDNRKWIGSYGIITVYEEDTEGIFEGNIFSAIQLEQNIPNPFDGTTEIIYSLPKPSPVTIQVYNSIGLPVFELVNVPMQHPGEYKVTFDATSLSNGVYFYSMRTPDFTETKQMVLMR